MGFWGKGEQITSPLGTPIPARMTLVPSVLRFGFMHHESAMMDMRSIESLGKAETLSLVVDFKKRFILVHFALTLRDPTTAGTTTCTCTYRMEIRFTRLTRITRLALPGGRSAVVISLQHPPQLFRKATDVEATHSVDRLSWNETELWHRQVAISDDISASMDAILALEKPVPYIDIGRWTTYCIDFNVDTELDVWSNVERYLREFNIQTMHDHKFELLQRGDHKLWETLDGQAAAMAAPNSALSLLGVPHVDLPFPVRYQLEACISRGILNEYNIDAAFLAQLDKLGPMEGRLLLEHIADKGSRIFDPNTIFALSNEIGNGADLEERGTGRDYLTLTRKVTVTPSTHYLSTPTLEMNNRVLRKYSKLSGHFLRVQFTDEIPEGRINPSADAKKNDELYTRIFRVLVNGIRVGDRHYELLAFGNSQLRENGAYFFSSSDGVTCDSIRRWMGDFATIKVVAKYAARLGQCFSTTRDIAGYPVPRLVEIRDVENNGHVFTDGVGKISRLWATIVADHMNHYEDPSAVQFRMGGCKGVLAVWEDCKSLEVHIRPTQQKFKGAVFNGLEIIRLSITTAPFLNQQTILILSGLGVADHVFHDLQDRDVDALNRAMRDKSAAVTELTRRIDENQTTLVMAKMVANGFMESDEPFMWTLLQLWRSHSLKNLKEKAKISVEDGAFVLGIADETGILRGHSRATELDLSARQSRERLSQIFIQVPDRKGNGEYKVVTGLCLVGRNPSLHPGDIRVVEAVDVHELRHMKNVVVFPTRGDRDIPSMLSGGDLDGDDFFVLWNKDLLPHETEWNVPPMNYEAPDAPVVAEEVSLRDLSAFFVLYMKNDSLPKIALAHRAQADRMDGGVKNRRCKYQPPPGCSSKPVLLEVVSLTSDPRIGLQLAHLHSKAVDYVKTGVPAEMPKALNPTEWPHWMEKKNRRQYHSRSVLGQLYDKVKTIDFHPIYDKPFDNRILQRYALSATILKAARKIKNQYDTALRRLMGSKEIGTEFEIWSAFILARPRVGSDYKLAEDVGREAGLLKRRFRDACVEAAGGRGDETLHPFVAAMYKVTQEEIRIALYECGQHGGSQDGVLRRKIQPSSMPLISFPWLFDRELGLIATGMSREPDIHAFGGWSSTAPRAPAPAPAVVVPDEIGTVAARVAAEMKLQELLDMDYVRTADGVVTHRGEPLTLFGQLLDDGDDELHEAGDEVEYVGVIRDEDGATGKDVQEDDSGNAGSAQSGKAVVLAGREVTPSADANMGLKQAATNDCARGTDKEKQPGDALAGRGAVANGHILQPLAVRPVPSPANKAWPTATSTLANELFTSLKFTTTPPLPRWQDATAKETGPGSVSRGPGGQRGDGAIKDAAGPPKANDEGGATQPNRPEGLNGAMRGAGWTIPVPTGCIGGDATEADDEDDPGSEIEIVEIVPVKENALARAARLFGR